jgi:hypothetical protein
LAALHCARAWLTALLSVEPEPYITAVTELSFDHFRSSHPMMVGVVLPPEPARSLQAFVHVAAWP